MEEPVSIRSRLWVLAGVLCLIIGVVGMVVPLLPTSNFVLLAAYCFSRGSRRWEAWLLGHPRFGPMPGRWCVPVESPHQREDFVTPGTPLPVWR